MSGRKIAIYYSWSRPGEVKAPVVVIENRFPTLFESRRMVYPRLQELSDPARFDQSIAGFLDQVLKKNFAAFVEQASAQTNSLVMEIERIADDGYQISLDDGLLDSVDTLIIISFDSIRTRQEASEAEITAVRRFLEEPDHLVFVCPHHDIGDAPNLSHEELMHIQEADFLHHGDNTIPPQQRFGGFGRSLLAGLGVPVKNRFGLHPATKADGSPAEIEIERDRDRLNLLRGVTNFNLHAHLPHLERIGDAVDRLDVLARQHVDLTAPPHRFTEDGRTTFDALLQSRPSTFSGDLLISDATLWSSTAGGVDSLRRLWTNVVQRAAKSVANHS